MKNKKIVIPFIMICILIILTLWFIGIIPKQIAKITATIYLNTCFPEMQLKYNNIEWSKYHGDYIIYFKDKDNNQYGLVIYPKYFPVILGQGMNQIEEKN